MASKRCFYEILSVSKTATQDEIKKAYKKLAIKYHPDRNQGDAEAVEMFKECAEAYEVLSDDEKRSRYDRFGHAGVAGGAGGGQQFHDINDIFSAFGDLFEGFDFFGGSGGRGQRRSRGGPTRGADLRTSITIELKEAALGCKRELEFPRHKSCERCAGTGSEPGTKPETCDYCGGHGQVVQAQGFFRVQTNCPACRGAGHIIRHKCNTCYGSGKTEEDVKVPVTIPPGIDNGMQICVRSEGETGPNNGPRGDLYVDVRVKQHSVFQREGTHLICHVPITYTQAALGATVQIPLIDGQDKLEIPAGTQPGEIFKLRGKGMPDPRGGRPGDLHVEVQLLVPKNVSKEHEALLRKLAEKELSEVHPHQKSWLEKLKDLFKGESD